MIKKALLQGLKFFVDYLLIIVFSLLGLMILAWMLGNPIGEAVYSTIFTLVLFGLIYSRAWNTAKRDIKTYNNEQPYWYKGLIMCIPLLAFNLLIAGLFALVQANIIPVRDIVVSATYSFPENEARQLVETTFGMAVTPFVRVYFSNLVGFLGGGTPPVVLFAGQLVIPVAAFLGYYAGMRKFYLSEVITKTSGKVKDKFNE